ncbi:MAG TPA: Wzt carbohydrate-binding domain-containing protein [Bryobacteraceae bacterium]|nr:Wzt carbohydrate-binding domain-containing protein [Bryobacteraceae bacterium]
MLKKMPLAFHNVYSPPLAAFEATAPDGAIIGLIGEDGAGQSQLLQLAAGLLQPQSGSIQRPESGRLLGPLDPLNLAPTPALLIDGTLALHDALVKERTAVALDRMRRAGSLVMLSSHDEDLLLRLADELWWLHEGRLAGRGDPSEILAGYRRHIAQRVRAWGASVQAPLSPKMRRGDGRAEISSIVTVGENSQPTSVWRSGELAVIKVAVKFHAAVEAPVVGIMIRTRVGLNVYGTNTELEGLALGPRAGGDSIEVSFAFRAELCAGDYTLTAASHDPDGVWHDWLEDAVAFSISDERYTAGVANLRATVRSSALPQAQHV